MRERERERERERDLQCIIMKYIVNIYCSGHVSGTTCIPAHCLSVLSVTAEA